MQNLVLGCLVDLCENIKVRFVGDHADLVEIETGDFIWHSLRTGILGMDGNLVLLGLIRFSE